MGDRGHVRHRAVRPWALIAAAVLAFAALAACGDGSTTSTTTVAPTTTVPVIKYDQPGPVTQVGTGFVDGTSLDGSAAYVEQEDPLFPELGCEGQPQPVLFRLPLAGGARELLGKGEDHLHGRIIHGPSDDQVAIVTGCEGFFTALWVGTETPDGHLDGIRKVPVGRVDDTQTLAPFSFSWSRDGMSLLAASNAVGAGPETTSGRIVRIDPGTGLLTTVFEAQAKGGVSQVDQLTDGSYVIAADGKVSIRNAQGAVQIEVAGNGFEAATDHKSAVAFGSEVLLLAPGAPRPVRLVPASPGKQVTSASPSPDGRAVVFNVHDLTGADNEISVLTVGDAKTTKVAGPGPLGRVFFSGDGAAVVFNQFRSAPDFVADVAVVRFTA